MSASVMSRNPFHRNSTRTMVDESCPPPPPPHSANPKTISRHTFSPSTRERSKAADNTTIFMVPIYDDRHQGADLLIVSPSKVSTSRVSTSKVSHHDRSETPARAPTPPPKPVIPQQCEDWDDFISWRKTEAVCKASSKPEKPRLENSAKEDIMRGFEEWKDYLSQMRIPGRRARPVSIVSTATTTAGRSLANRSSMCSVSTVSSTSSSKARSLRKTSRSRHLRAYYSMGCLLRNRFNPSNNEPIISPIADILRNSSSRPQLAKRRPTSQHSLPANWTYFCSPPPHPPPNKPLPALPCAAQKGQKRTRKRNRSVVEMKERKRFQFLLWQ
ncbi:hypothetical protein KVR01_010668 [Diaporthe batatas]|uniref:uncharacterized protein n=1 Tax=Diaporthe batatas TaxID=748121 RepID=UPI001D0433A3|nr:uncharacterized protein KVR01_010668 [Diaporthe batatas]KAG8160031.1 hypothetical protein KVR01_010668 [Diaporthe batatas]